MNIDFIKKNWEKVLLGVVLVGLLIAVISLPIKIAREKRDLKNLRISITERPVEPIPEVDLGTVQNTLRRTQHDFRMDLTTSNRVFNPVPWRRTAGGQLFRVNTGDEIGVRAVRVDTISPLYLVVTFDSVLRTESGPRYAIGIERQAATSRRARAKRQSYASVGDKTDAFVLRDIKGPAENPTAVELELTEIGQRVTVAPDEPFKHVDGYMADLTYPPDNRRWTDKRVGDLITVEREYYNIVAITKDEVVLSAPSRKKTALQWKPGS